MTKKRIRQDNDETFLWFTATSFGDGGDIGSEDYGDWATEDSLERGETPVRNRRSRSLHRLQAEKQRPSNGSGPHLRSFLKTRVRFSFSPLHRRLRTRFLSLPLRRPFLLLRFRKISQSSNFDLENSLFLKVWIGVWFCRTRFFLGTQRGSLWFTRRIPSLASEVRLVLTLLLSLCLNVSCWLCNLLKPCTQDLSETDVMNL